MIVKHEVNNLDADVEIKRFHDNVFAIKDYLCKDPLMIENLVRIIEDYLREVVELCQDLNVVHVGSPVCDKIDDLYKMSNKGKEEIDRLLLA